MDTTFYIELITKVFENKKIKALLDIEEDVIIKSELSKKSSNTFLMDIYGKKEGSWLRIYRAEIKDDDRSKDPVNITQYMLANNNHILKYKVEDVKKGVIYNSLGIFAYYNDTLKPINVSSDYSHDNLKFPGRLYELIVKFISEPSNIDFTNSPPEELNSFV